MIVPCRLVRVVDFPRDSTEFDRALNFVDAIFGFSVTLLVTTLQVPPAAAWNSVGALLGSGLGDQLMAFAISFVVVAAVFLASIPLAYRIGPDNAKWAWLSLLVLSPVTGLLVRRFSRSRSPLRRPGPDPRTPSH